MGLLDFLSAGLTSATGAAGAYQNAKANVAQQQKDDGIKQAMQQVAMLKQQHDQEINDALKRAQTSKALQPPRPVNPPTPLPVVGPDGKRIYRSQQEALGQEAPSPVTPPEPIVPVMQGGKPVYTTRSKAVGGEAPSVQQSFTPLSTGNPDDPDGPPQIHAFNTRTGQAGPVIGSGKTPATKIESATNTAAKARLEAAISEMNNAHGGMAEYEKALSSGKASINGLQQFAGATANSFTHDDPASRAIQSTALAVLNRSNPELARYIRRGLSFAEGESMVSNRPSDFRTKMAAFLSTAASGASPEMIGDIQSRRNSILTPLNSNVGSRKPAKAPAADAEGAWAAKNPPKAGESFEAYHQRFLKTKGG